MKEDVVVDNLDSQIVQILKKDGRASNAHIARALGVSEGTVRRRLKMLIDGGVVHVNVSLDPAKMGLTTEAIIGLEVDPDKMDPVCASIAAFDEIGYVTSAMWSPVVKAIIALAMVETEHLLGEIWAEIYQDLPAYQ